MILEPQSAGAVCVRETEVEITIAKIKKNRTAEIWVSLREFKGQQYVDIREHFLTPDDQAWHPTKKGIMVLPSLLPQVLKGLQALEDVSELGTIASIQNSSRGEIQVGFREFGKTRYGELRIWYLPGEGNEKKPSPRGVTFRLDLVESLLDALRDAAGHLKIG